jgi:hypothetical protein
VNIKSTNAPVASVPAGAAKATKAAAPKAEAQEPKDWTVLLYVAGDNDLEPYAAKMMQQIEDKCGTTDKVNVVAQLGRMSQPALKQLYAGQGRKYEPTNIDGDWGGIRRYVVTQAPDRTTKNEDKILSKCVDKIENRQMSNATTLADFLVYGMKEYPAKHYMVALCDHGGAWLGAFTSDASATGHDIMKPGDIASAFKVAETATGKKPAVVDMVACLMASSEVAYEMKDRAKYLLASEEIGTTASFDYGPVINKITQASEKGKPLSAKALSQQIVHHYDDKPAAFKTKSAIDLTKMEGVKNSVKTLVEKLNVTKVNPHVIAEAIQGSQNFGITRNQLYGFYDQIHDLAGFADNLANSDIKDKALKSAAQAVVESVKGAVVDNLAHDYTRLESKGEGITVDGKEHFTDYREFHGHYDTHGMSIFAPLSSKLTEGPKMNEYKDLSFSKDTGWGDFMKSFNKKLASTPLESQGHIVSRPADPDMSARFSEGNVAA